MTIAEIREQLAEHVPALRARYGHLPVLDHVGTMVAGDTGEYVLALHDEPNGATYMLGPYPPSVPIERAMDAAKGQVYAAFN